jgi:hypothetical protein
MENKVYSIKSYVYQAFSLLLPQLAFCDRCASCVSPLGIKASLLHLLAPTDSTTVSQFMKISYFNVTTLQKIHKSISSWRVSRSKTVCKIM